MIKFHTKGPRDINLEVAVARPIHPRDYYLFNNLDEWILNKEFVKSN